MEETKLLEESSEKSAIYDQQTKDSDWRLSLSRLIIKNALSNENDLTPDIIEALSGSIPVIGKIPQVIYNDGRRIIIDNFDGNDIRNIIAVVKIVSSTWFCYSHGTSLVDNQSPLNGTMFRFPLLCKARRPQKHKDQDLIEIEFIGNPDDAYIVREDGSLRVMMKEERKYILSRFSKECTDGLQRQFSALTTQRSEQPAIATSCLLE